MARASAGVPAPGQTLYAPYSWPIHVHPRHNLGLTGAPAKGTGPDLSHSIGLWQGCGGDIGAWLRPFRPFPLSLLSRRAWRGWFDGQPVAVQRDERTGQGAA